MGRPESELVFRSSFHFYRKLIRALLARAILMAHSSLAIWLTVKLLSDSRFYGLYVYSVLLYILEIFFVIYFNKGVEWKSFCTAFLCYLLSIVPALAIQRLLLTTGDDVNNSSNSTILNSTEKSVTQTTGTPAPKTLALVGDGFAKDLPSIFTDVNATSLQEQSMMIVLILCRWLLPRGRIDRNSMSQLLLMYSGISADIMDFSDLFNNQPADVGGYWRYILIGVWSWSLLQFTIVVRSGPLARAKDHGYESGNDVSGSGNEKESLLGEILPILMILFMQDGPFFAARAYAIVELRIMNYTMFFFTLKNVLTLILTFYRLLVLCKCVADEGNDLLSRQSILDTLRLKVNTQ